MNFKTMVIMAALSVTLCLIGSAYSDPKDDFPSFCYVFADQNGFHVEFNVGESLNIGGSFVKENFGNTDIGVPTVLYDKYKTNRTVGNRVYEVNVLYSTGENRFTFQYYNLNPVFNIKPSNMGIVTNENDCIVEKVEERFQLNFFLNKTTDRGGFLVLKKFGDDIGNVKTVENVMKLNKKFYIVNSLFTTGKNGFKFNHFQRILYIDGSANAYSTL